MSNTIAIHYSSVEPIICEIENMFVIGQRVNKNYPNEFEFILEANEEGHYVVSDKNIGGTVLIVHNEHSPNWVQIEYDLGNTYVLDELLRNITLKLNTTAFIGYNQTTSGDFRFALFVNGKLIRSIYQKYIEFHNQIRLMDNFGNKLNFEKTDFGIPFTQELPKEQELDFNTLNYWQEQLGFIYQERRSIEYLHMEIIKFKN